ncbi:unnamed protein product [Closterium sp. Yama58-4]|nr:unnamed protein product [Closterium sp. Yama58-4]
MSSFRRSVLQRLRTAVILIPAILVIGPHFDVRLPPVAAQGADWSRESDGGGEGAGGGGSFAETSSLSYTCPQEMASRPYSDSFDPSALLSAKFISVGRLYEQLSKARLHLGEVLSVARHTGRTLILPSVGNSRIGTVADYAFPFCTYFDPGRLGQFVPWVSEEFFYGQVVPAWRAAGRGGGSVVALVLGDAKMKACDVRASYAKIGRNTNTPGLQPNVSLRADASLLLNRALLSPALCTRTCTTKRRAKPPGAEDLLGRDRGATVLPGEEPMVALGRTGGGEGEMEEEEEEGKREKEGEGRLASESRRFLVYPRHLHLAADHLITKHMQLQEGGASRGGRKEESAENGRGHMQGGRGGGRDVGAMGMVAAHWRLEKAFRAGVRLQQVAACARGLVDTVRGWAKRVGKEHGEQQLAVFLATDLTPDNSKEHQETHGPYSLSFGPYSLSFGPYSLSFGPYSLSFGPYSLSFGPYSLSFGPYSLSFSPYSLSFGPYSLSFGPYSLSFGPYSLSFSPYSLSFGPYSLSLGPYSLSFSPYSLSFGPYSLSFGPYSLSFSPYSLSFGPYSLSFGPYSLSFSPYSLSFGPYSLSFGPYSLSFGPYSLSFGPYSL